MTRTIKQRKHTPFALRIVPWLFPKVEKVFPWLAHRFFIYIFFHPLRYRMPASEKEASRLASKSFLTVNGKRIQLYEWGSGARSVLLVHGWAGRATQFRKFIQPLNDAGFHVYAFDAPSHGLSQGSKTDIREYEAALKAVWLHVGSPPSVITHSFGGAAALYSISLGTPIRTLVTISGPAIGETILQSYKKVLHASSKTINYFRKYVIRKSGKPFEAWTSLEFVKHVPEDLHLLLVHDEADTEVTIDHPIALKKAFPSAEFFTTNGLGHIRILKSDEVIVKSVSFLTSEGRR